MKFLVVLAALLYTAQGQIVMSGSCPSKVDVIPNFDVAAYSGTWNEIYRYEHANQLNADCTTATYTLVNGTVNVLNAQVVNATKYTIAGTAVPNPAGNGSGMLLVNFPTAANIYTDYWVQWTDYTGVSLVYACTNQGINKRVSSWILSRSKTLSPAAILAISPVIEKTAGLDWDFYRQTSQTETACAANSTVETTDFYMY